MLALAAAAFLLLVAGQEEKNPGVCNFPLGLSDGSIGDDRLSSPTGDASAGRLGNAEGAWCFGNASVAALTAVLSLSLPTRRLVAGLASQGPPLKLHNATYEHIVGFSVHHSLDESEWVEFNGGTLFFDTDKNDTIDAITYNPTTTTIVLAQYIRINVTMLVSGSADICLRFELYGCDTDLQPETHLHASTTPTGKIEVRWGVPTADTSLETDKAAPVPLRPSGYVVRYRAEGAPAPLSAATAAHSLALEDVRLGAAYNIALQCILLGDVLLNCGDVRVEAYPPCPSEWTGGNEYHCFLYMPEAASFEDAKDSCLSLDVQDSLGKLGDFVGDLESAFLVSRIISEDVSQLWLIGDTCEENDDCCRILKKEGNAFKQFNCEDEILTSALCLRDHKGEGAKLRISVVEAFEDGTSVNVKWGYEGIGWKTDKLQAKLWTETANPTISTFSTLNDSFVMKDLKSETMYSILLRPAPNIRSDEITYKFIIVDYSKEAGGYGALLTPISMSLYVIWSGTLKVKWETARTYAVSGDIKEASKYSISYEKVASGSNTKQVKEESKREFHLSPLEIKTKYLFSLECYFADKFHPCGSASIRTDPPDSFNRDESLVFTIYEWFEDSSKNWLEAESDCQERTGHLTSILTQVEGTTLLNILPTRDAKAWTGAKLVRNGTSYWSDGHRITYLPMAKNSGVLQTMESCCRALNEFGKLRLTGGKCSDNLPYVCKYLVKDILHPVEVSTKWQKWDSFEVGWKLPEKGWLPTEYRVSVCQEGAGECLEENGLKDLKFVAEGLKEFTPYDVLVFGSFEPIPGYTAQTKKKIFTYPRKAVREDVSTTGEVTLATPILVAMGRKNAEVTAAVSKTGGSTITKSGDVEKIEFSGLTPEDTYDVLVEEKNGAWKHNFKLEAVPSCDKSDVSIGTKCLSLVKDLADFQKAVEICGTRRQSAATLEQKLWTEDKMDTLRSVIEEMGYQSAIWMNKPSDNSIIEQDAACPTDSSNFKCCSYSISQNKVLCSNCCTEKRAFICAYETAANLGQVVDLNPSEIGNKSLGVQWSHPEGVSWNIKRYEVYWYSAEKDQTPDGTKSKIVEGSTSVVLDSLDFGTEYHVGVLPLGSKRMKGKELRITLATLEPRPTLLVKVEASGVARVSSPTLVEKGRGAESVTVEVRDADTRSTLVVMQGVAEGAEVTGLEPGIEYQVEMRTNEKDKRSFKFNTTFRALPSCGEGQIQSGPVCVWPGEKPRVAREAAEVCRDAAGQLLDFRSQKQLGPQVKARLAAQVSAKFWLDMAGEKKTAAMVDGTKGDCSKTENSDVVCCTFEVDSNEELNDLKCDCCEGPRPFACMSKAKIDMGSIGQFTVVNLSSSAVTLEWTLESGGSSWKPPSFLVNWSERSQRSKREVSQQLVVKKPEVTLQQLKPDTSYQVTVAPYTDSSQIEGAGKETVVRTTQAITVAGISDSGCTMVILKISCCITVILGTLFTVFVFIATKMLYIDCLAHLLSELALLGAYLNILVSSAQSYSLDSECVRASPSLCIAVAALIQFFFQAVFLLMALEAMLVASALKDYLPTFIGSMTPFMLLVVGFGIPGILNIILAAIAGDGYTDKTDNCWLDLRGKAMLPSILPVIVFAVFTLFLLLSVFDADEPKEGSPPALAARGKVYLKTRWGCFVILVFTVVCYSTGMVGASNKDKILNSMFIAFSTALGILIPLTRIRWDDQVRQQLKRGLFANFRDDGGIRVTPAPDFSSSEPHPLLPMAELKFKQKQLSDLARKRQATIREEDETVWHR